MLLSCQIRLIPGCIQSLDPSQARCTNCPDGVLGADLAHHWRFALRIELEPEGSDIRLDVVNEDMAIWVYVDEKEGDEVREQSPAWGQVSIVILGMS